MKLKCEYCQTELKDDMHYYCHRCSATYCPSCWFSNCVCKCNDHLTKKEAEEKKMASLKEEAQAFKPSISLNIADLDFVSVELDLKKEERVNNKGETFSYMYVEQDGEKYRVPMIVVKDLKAILEKMPSLAHFSVLKKGTGMDTTYTILPRTDVAE